MADKRGSQEDIVEGSESSKHARNPSGNSLEMEKLPSSRTPPNELESSAGAGGRSESPASASATPVGVSVGATGMTGSAGSLAGMPKTGSLTRGPIVNISDESGKPKSLTESKVKIACFFF